MLYGAKEHLLKIISLSAVGMSLGCSKTMLEVKYPQMTSSSEDYAELSKLAVGLDSKLEAPLRDAIMKSLKACPLFTEITLMDKPVRVSGTNPKDYFDALIKRSQQAQTSQGVMSIQIEAFTENPQLEKSQSLVLVYQNSNDWYPSYGIPLTGTLGFPSRPEIAPIWNIKKRDTYIRMEKVQYVLRFVMYNKIAGKIIHDRIVNNTSTLYNYSRKSALKKQKFTEQIQNSVINEILFYACPAKESVTRNLYYQKQPDPNADEINEGVDLVEQNRWNLAANKWKNVLLKDNKNAIAHHNLGIHYERFGAIFQSLDHFKKAKKGPLPKLPSDNVYDEILNRYQPHASGMPIYPQVAFVTGGNRAFVRSDYLQLSEAESYSIYRIEPLVSPETSRTSGQTIREVGIFKVTASPNQFYPGQIKEFLINYPVRPGDFLIAE